MKSRWGEWNSFLIFEKETQKHKEEVKKLIIFDFVKPIYI
jgi:hypothetical protein